MQLRVGCGRDNLMFQDSLQQHKSKTLCSKVIKEWNSLPLSLRQITSIKSFKTKLKTFFFKEAFKEFISDNP